ncbi:MAG: NUDIX hydrolase, partial [Bacteroidaceae bacterium]|nr:NUDIX hydrolase [Bacteroidaceae bacterium]
MKNDPQPWTILHSEYLIRRPWLTARRDHVRLPNGSENPEHYVLEYPDWVNVIARTKDGRFVLIRQYRHGLRQTAYEVCAGCIDPEDVSPEVAARRELLEETGYGGGTWKLLTVICGNPSTTNNLTYCFVAEG